MPIVVVQNLSRSTISLGSSIGRIDPYSVKRADLSVSELELAKDNLVGMASAGIISWAVESVSGGEDDSAEFLPLSNSGTKNTARIDLYVAPSGSNDNTGLLPSSPLQSLEAAFARIPDIVAKPVVIHLASGTYSWESQLGPKQLYQPIAIVGDGAKQATDQALTELVAARSALSGTGQRLIKTSALTVNAYQGKTVEILTGAAAGDRRTIRHNTTTDVVPVHAFKAAVAPGDQFRIVEPAVVVQFSTGLNHALAPLHAAGLGTPVLWERGITELMGGSTPPCLFLANLRIEDDGTGFASDFRAASTCFYMAGVELGENVNCGYVFPQGNSICAGVDKYFGNFGTSTFELAATLGLTSSPTDWVGWGLSMEPGPIYTMVPFRGFLVWTEETQNSVPVSGVNWVVFGGALKGTATNGAALDGFWRFGDGSKVWLAAADASLPVLVDVDGGSAGHAALRSEGGSAVTLDGVEVVKTGAGNGVSAGGEHISQLIPGNLAMMDNVSISAPRIAVSVTNGGGIYVRELPTLPVVPSEAEAAVFQGRETGTPVATSTLASLGNGDALVNPTQADGTRIMRVT